MTGRRDRANPQLHRSAAVAYSPSVTREEHAMANKEQKRSTREAKKPKQKKKEKPAGKPQAAKP
jgi:hypothetical protein